MDKFTGRFKKLFEDRAIDLDVAAVRHHPYVDLDDIIEADPNYATLERGQLRHLDRLAGQSDGVVMVRHAPPLAGRAERPIFAELRPLDAVRTGTRRHNFTDKGGKLWDHHITGRADDGAFSKGWAKHIDRHEKLDDHYGVNDPSDHAHVTEAKYLFPPGKPATTPCSLDHEDPGHLIDENGRGYHEGRPWTNHNHTAMPTEKLLHHLGRRDHPDGDDTVHTSPGKDPRANRAKRIDVHPWALERMAEAETVYFALEGCLKADSILTAIIREGRNASVFSVPSVTLWDCGADLHAFAQQYLRGKLVICVPDSDWEDPEKDGAVIAQSLYARDQLEAWLGAGSVHIAAPTPHPVTGKKRGIDDYLADGEKLPELVIIDRRPPAALDGWGSAARRSEGRARDTRMLRFLSLHADETTGEYHAPLDTMARRSGMNRESVRQALISLQEAGAIAVDAGSLRTADKQWIPWPDHNPYGADWGVTGWAANEKSWADMPTLTVMSAPLDFRSRTSRELTVDALERPLGAYTAAWRAAG